MMTGVYAQKDEQGKIQQYFCDPEAGIIYKMEKGIYRNQDGIGSIARSSAYAGAVVIGPTISRLLRGRQVYIRAEGVILSVLITAALLLLMNFLIDRSEKKRKAFIAEHAQRKYAGPDEMRECFRKGKKVRWMLLAWIALFICLIRLSVYIYMTDSETSAFFIGYPSILMLFLSIKLLAPIQLIRLKMAIGRM